jgi:hypothetical protein
VAVSLPAEPYAPVYTVAEPAPAAPGATVTRGLGQTRVAVPQALAAGPYALRDDKGRLAAAFSLNVRGEESNLQRVPAEEVEAALGAGSVVTVDHGGSLTKALQGQGLRTLELLPWLMLALLLVLVVESFLANRFYRQPAAEPDRQPTA